MRPARSLTSRALQLLAQREQSRVELQRKLLAHAVADDQARLEAAGGAPQPCSAGSPFGGARDAASSESSDNTDAAAEPVSAECRVEAVLVWLEANGFSSDERFAEARVNARAARHGERRIRQELKLHGVTLPAEAAQRLRETEALRARSVWQRRFGLPPQTAAEAAKQSRFLLARGFSAEVVRQVVRQQQGADKPSADAGDDPAHDHGGVAGVDGNDDDAIGAPAHAADD